MQKTINQSNERIKLLHLRFKNVIYKSEVPLFRGAVIKAISKNDDILFHNHKGNNFRYSYPLIQYKRINQKGVIVCINEGTEIIGKFFSQCDFNFTIGERIISMEIESIKANQYLIQTWESSFYYRIRKWLPLNQYNYQEYLKLEGVNEKCQFLEKILIGNLLSFTKGIGLYIDKEIKCQITQMSEPTIQIFKNVKMMSFDIEFKTNLSLPDYIGLGKGASINYGTVTQIRKDTKAQ